MIAIGALLFLSALSSQAALPSPYTRLSTLRAQVMALEENLIEGLKSQKEAKQSLRQIQKLLKLQEEERRLGQARLTQLESTILELEERARTLREKISKEENSIRKALTDIERSAHTPPRSFFLPEQEKTEAPRRKTLALWSLKSLKEIKAYKENLLDAEKLEQKILEEKQELTYLFQDLNEKEGILELNRQLQLDLLQRKHEERLKQLEYYRSLKKAEASVESLIQGLPSQAKTGRLPREKLPMPIAGSIVSPFGRVFDPKSNLHVFKKGIDIAPKPHAKEVQSVLAGTIAYAGEMGELGKLALVDHGNHFYSLYGRLGQIHKKTGEKLAQGDPVGSVNDAGAPVYFEIRMRNIAVNPLQWLSK